MYFNIIVFIMIRLTHMVLLMIYRHLRIHLQEVVSESQVRQGSLPGRQLNQIN